MLVRNDLADQRYRSLSSTGVKLQRSPIYYETDLQVGLGELATLNALQALDFYNYAVAVEA